MKGNILKTSMYVLSSIAVIVVFILLFRQCSGNESTKETSLESSLSQTTVQMDTVKKVNKIDLNEKSHLVESQKTSGSEQSSVIQKKLSKTGLNEKTLLVGSQKTGGSVQTSVVQKKVNSNSLDATGLPMGKTDQAFVQEEFQADFNTQFNKYVENEEKSKSVDILKDDLNKLTGKVNVLEKNVNALLEKLRLFSEEKENRILAKELIKKEKEVDSTRILDTSKVDDAYKYKDPTHVLAGGFSTYEKWTGFGSQGSYTYRINKFVSSGLQANAFLKYGKYNGDRALFMGFRTNLHIFPLFVENSRFDLYAGGTAGVNLDDSVETFKMMGYIGSSYDFCKHWGVFVEAGTIGVMGLRLTF